MFFRTTPAGSTRNGRRTLTRGRSPARASRSSHPSLLRGPRASVPTARTFGPAPGGCGRPSDGGSARAHRRGRYRALAMDRLGPADFEGERLLRAGRWAVCFAAEWCGFCDEFLPRFGRLASTPGLSLAIGDLTDLASPLWDRFRIDVVPT